MKMAFMLTRKFPYFFLCIFQWTRCKRRNHSCPILESEEADQITAAGFSEKCLSRGSQAVNTTPVLA